ncbi:zinc ABC transporter substrate-binding protein AztC [Mycobacterium deserti]|uniref:Zinc ABC transporter substrate-binding protein AztC n=1 Tax=Mycobacterium deserti TaxID=2978347 RepID=A0ABT2M6L5_9MYCO|nr:zinc ABC transporter substrate-binding protein AztC [Mycobacterium deserti]MCT7657908.1 zinc ABC transporter substrate-binding protein AztC [Mycobacterium deserti]
MKQVLRGVLVALVALLSACTGGGNAPSSEPRIVVTTNILGDVVRNIVGDTAEVRVLMKPNADPHSFGISAQEAAAMTTADLVVYNGLGLEESLQRHVDSAAEDGVPTLAVGDHVEPIRYSSGDSVGRPDPHFWTDPQRMLAGTDAIVDALRERVPDIDVEEVSTYADNYRNELRRLSDSMTEQFGKIPAERRKLVTNHHVLGYMAQRFGFTIIGAIVPSGTTLASPSSSDLESLAGAVRSAGVPAVFVDSSHPDRLARVLAEEAGVDVDVVSLYSESLSEPGTSGATYLDMMRTNTEAIVSGLTSR